MSDPVVWVSKSVPVQAYYVTHDVVGEISDAIGASRCQVAYVPGGKMLAEWFFAGTESFTAFVGEYLVRGIDGELTSLDAKTFHRHYEQQVAEVEAPVFTDEVLGTLLGVSIMSDETLEALFERPDGTHMTMVQAVEPKPQKSPTPDKEESNKKPQPYGSNKKKD